MTMSTTTNIVGIFIIIGGVNVLTYLYNQRNLLTRWWVADNSSTCLWSRGGWKDKYRRRGANKEGMLITRWKTRLKALGLIPTTVPCDIMMIERQYIIPTHVHKATKHACLCSHPHTCTHNGVAGGFQPLLAATAQACPSTHTV